MLEAEVFRIRTDTGERIGAMTAATTTTEPSRLSTAAPASSSAEKIAAMHSAAQDACNPHEQLYSDKARDTGDVSAKSTHAHTQGTSRERLTSPRTPADNATQRHILAERAATSFRQDRRLQRGQVASRKSGHVAQSSHAPKADSPMWNGLPNSVLHASMSPTCLPLPASDSGLVCTVPVATIEPIRHLPSTMPASTAKANSNAFACQESLTAEDDEGDVEYKWRLTGISATRFQHLVTQMQFRVSEGRGQCLYELGVSDDGTPRGLTRRDFDESVQTIQRMAAQLQLEATLLQCCSVSRAEVKLAGKSPIRQSNVPLLRGPEVEGIQPQGGDEEELLCGEIMVSRRQCSSAHDLSVAFCGAVGCGKSTLMAVLLTARLDDGCGGTRQSLFNHKHELDSGRTSSLASRVWTVPQDATDAYPRQNYESPTSRRQQPDVPVPSRFRPSWSPASSPVASAAPPTPPFTCASPRSITLLDAGGDITKTMLFGLMSRKPDYVCVCVAADTSDILELSLYAEVCCAMNTPFLVAVTKCDCVEEFELDGLMMELTVVLEKVGCVAEQVESMQTAAEYCRDWLPRHREAAVDGSNTYAGSTSPTTEGSPAITERLRVPVFCVSSVEGGEGLDLFRSCLSHLQNPPPSPPLSPQSCASRPPFEVLLDCAFEVDDVGPVVHGRVARGPVEVGCTCYIGPGSDGRFYTVLVRGVHVEGEHVNMAQVGDEATFALDRLPKMVTVSHKGKVLVRQPERVTMAFEAAVQVLSQSISAHMEPIMYTRNARQAVNVVAVSSAPSDQVAGAAPEGRRECTVQCRFLFRPEVVGPGDAVVLHWAPRGIAVGRITAVGASGG
ncbi:hypothetical protein ABL78_0426 [Leptomonas seymouri]|uniref:Tr-type G domain-containing protein n=1 Tax=Leptomonas seymouri TaxID=5684 RepID=A0A0N0P8Y7_LEPSE|nr:hypothetical protein ABL78_0426 [Leptomonas seymouri]|eukprot:KPI90496.1 hypothetical protein ABL78_0426 [Leptomonas seymouri]